jgi:hypothetical protein
MNREFKNITYYITIQLLLMNIFIFLSFSYPFIYFVSLITSYIIFIIISILIFILFLIIFIIAKKYNLGRHCIVIFYENEICIYNKKKTKKHTITNHEIEKIIKCNNKKSLHFKNITFYIKIKNKYNMVILKNLTAEFEESMIKFSCDNNLEYLNEGEIYEN